MHGVAAVEYSRDVGQPVADAHQTPEPQLSIVWVPVRLEEQRNAPVHPHQENEQQLCAPEIHATRQARVRARNNQ